jgi:hypothetical protein
VRWPSEGRSCCLGVVKDDVGVGRELAVHGAGARGEDPRREVGGSGKRGARVTGGADDGDAAAGGVEEARGGLTAEVERQHVHRARRSGWRRRTPPGCPRRSTRCRSRVGSTRGSPTTRARGAAGRRAVVEPEHQRAGHRRAHRRGQRVRVVPVRVAGALRRRVPRAPGRRVALRPF